MDLLAGYGSDDSQGGDNAPAAAPAVHTAPAAKSVGARLVALPPPTQPGSGGGGGLFASLPRPSADAWPGPGSLAGAGFGLAPEPASAPKPAAGKPPAPKKVVQLRTMKPLAALDDEGDDQPKKKLRASRTGLSFLDSLPAPKHDSGMAPSDAFGGGSSSASRSLGGGHEPAEPAAGRGSSDSAHPAAAAAAQQYMSNDAYRVSQPPNAAADPEYGGVAPSTAAGPSYDAAAPPANYTHTDYGYTDHTQPAADSSGAAGYGAAQPDGNVMLAAAMAQESGRGGGGGGPADPFAGLNIQFKEVNQAKLTYVDPSRKAAMKGTRQALGRDYEMQLRSDADKAEPQKLAKRKHQISALYHASKMKELEMLSDHGQTLKTKRETQAKYGW